VDTKKGAFICKRGASLLYAQDFEIVKLQSSSFKKLGQLLDSHKYSTQQSKYTNSVSGYSAYTNSMTVYFVQYTLHILTQGQYTLHTLILGEVAVFRSCLRNSQYS